ncbi:MAG TPA: tRNA 2-thiouridine(34) synthase MnmA [Candidatus Paceibacterota bacterium]
MKKKVVFVGLSGGVDSAVSAAMLLKQGYEVVGVFIKTWHPEFLECNEEEERRDAMRVSAFLDIPFLTFNFEDVYKKEVADYMIREYRAGRTPNPDVMCNKEVKFGVFLKKALAMGADYVATGHYASVQPLQNFSGLLHPEGGVKPNNYFEFFHLFKGKDPAKDQSYFLWTLKQEQLSRIIFPVGNLKKSEVRKLAKKFKLPVAAKKDSQGICFLGEVDLKEFLKHYIKEKKGKVLNTEGEEIGFHHGVVFHTLGERHGFTITKKSPNDSRYYIVNKDIKKNILIVSQAPHKSDLWGAATSLTCGETNWISIIPEENKGYTAQIRYHGEFFECMVKILPKNKAEIVFSKPVLAAPGQSIVVYDRDTCMGGGVVK